MKPDKGKEKSARPWRGRALAAAVCLAGLLFAHHRIFLSGFRLSPGDTGDAALVAYLLEHDHRWLMQQAPHQSLWDTPIFYPQPNAGAYTDIMAGAVPFYSPWRWLGLPPDTAFQMWLLTASALNFVAFYLYLRRLLRIKPVAAAAGAFLFAYGSARIIQEWHPQLVPAFYTVASAAGLWLIFDRGRTAWGLALFFGGFVAQLYTSFYWAWFLALAYAAALGCAMASRGCRTPVLGVLRKEWPKVLLSGGAALLVAAPLVWHYAAAARTTGVWPYAPELLAGIPSWFKQTPGSWLYGWLDPYLQLPQNPDFWEEANGIGFFTLLLAAYGFHTGRRRRSLALLGLVVLVLACLASRLPDGLSLWRLVYETVPGAKAIRAVGRIGLFLVFVPGVAVAYAIHRMRSAGIAGACLLLVALEQGVTAPQHDKLAFRESVARVASQVDARCACFLYSPREGHPVIAHTTAMHASLVSGVPTLNAASGVSAPGWQFGDPRMAAPTDRDRLESALSRWWARYPSLHSVCWIQADSGGLSRVWIPSQETMNRR